MSGEREPAVVLDRTSGAEKEGQDAKAQLAQTVHRAGLVFDVRGAFTDEDVKGDSPWESRANLARARALAEELGAVLVVREPSRLWRGRPEVGLALVEGVPDLEVLGKPAWSRRAGTWVDDSLGSQIVRFIDLAMSGEEKEKVVERTGNAMLEIKEGRRATKSGKPHHRPPVEVAPAHLDAARAILARGGRGAMSEAHREVLRLRGYFEARDPRTAKGRNVSKATLGKLLGVYSVNKGDASERGPAAAGTLSNGQGSLDDGAAGGES